MKMYPLLLLPLLACGHDLEDAETKMAGVGLNPGEIGPAPVPAGGFVEYDLVEFAGGGLSLASLGLLLYDEIGPGQAGEQPPYAAVYGLSFLFDELVPAPDAQHGTFGKPPDVEDSCWTTYEPFSFLLASTADVGDAVEFVSADGSTSFQQGRTPPIYPPDPQDVFVYYFGIENWVSEPLIGYEPGATNSPDDMVEKVIRPVNYTPGAEVEFRFPGGISPLEAPVSSIPLPSRHVEATPIKLPNRATGLMLEWEGTVWDGRGNSSGDAAPASACVQFAERVGGAPAAPADCLVEAQSDLLTGQIYTGPWDTTDGEVTFKWQPGEVEGESVVLNVRFLAPVDETDPFIVEGRVPVSATEEVEAAWIRDPDDARGKPAQLDKHAPDEPVPQGYRNPLACDDQEDVEWGVDRNLTYADGSWRTELQGDPSSNLVEVSCRLADDGEFTLTNEHLASALEYARRKDAQGSIFYFSRSTHTELTVPAVRDQQGFKREITPVLVQSNAVKIGRFWLGDGFQD